MDNNSVFVVFSIAKECDAIVINWPNDLFGTKVDNTFYACSDWPKYNALK